jgi:hypothetical protein
VGFDKVSVSHWEMNVERIPFNFFSFAVMIGCAVLTRFYSTVQFLQTRFADFVAKNISPFYGIWLQVD